MAAIVIALSMLAGSATAGASVAPTPGKVTFLLNASSPFAPYVTNSTTAQRQWMRDHYWRMRTYPPFFDQALSWSPPAHIYADLYAIYRDYDQALVSQHPDWVLRDSQGQPLYIPYGCSGGSCPQYAADVGSPGWRAHWISQARAQLDKGYSGLFVDDVNLSLHVGNGQGQQVRPLDARTGQPMTDQNWRRYVAEFTEQIRAELPEIPISHNSLWWESHSDPYFQRTIAAADALEIERGFSDPNLGAGTYQALLDHIAWLHARGKSVILEPYNLTTLAKREYELANYFLIQEGEDALAAGDAAYPDNWWTGWETDLGTPEGARQQWNGLHRRDFARGMTLVNPPDAPTRTVGLPSGSVWTDLQGTPVTSVTLSARQGKVLREQPQSPPPPPADTTPPETTIDSGPSGEITQTSVGFAFSASEAGSSFECRLDAGAFTPCSSPQGYSSLAVGGHSFQVRATDAAGNVEPIPATRSFSVVSPPPPPPPDPDPTIDPDPKPPVTLKPKKPKVHTGRRIVLRGEAPAAAEVEIRQRRGGEWRTVALTSTEAAGSYEVSLTARSSGLQRFRATSPSAGDSRTVRVRVRG